MKKRILFMMLIIIMLFLMNSIVSDNYVYAQEEKSTVGTVITGTSSGGSTAVTTYYADLPDDWFGLRQVFSLDSKDKPVAGNHYYVQKNNTMEDDFLVKSIILGWNGPGDLPTTGDDTQDAEMLTWLHQMAIWVISAKMGYSELDETIANTLFVDGNMENEEYLELKDLKTSTGHDFSSLDTDFNDIVKQMVEDAGPYEGGVTPSKYAELDITGKQKEEDDYYISGPIQSSLHLQQDGSNYHDHIRNYTLEITNRVKDAIIIDKDGKEIKPTDELKNIEDIYYVKVPKSSLTSESNIVTVKTVIYDGDNDFEGKAAFQYVNESKKAPITKANSKPFKYGATLDVEFNVPKSSKQAVEIPNTKMDAHLIVYVIGILLIISGFILIYMFNKKKV